MVTSFYCLRLCVFLALFPFLRGALTWPVLQKTKLLNQSQDISPHSVHLVAPEEHRTLPVKGFQVMAEDDVPGDLSYDTDEILQGAVLSTQERLPFLSVFRLPKMICNFNVDAADRKWPAKFTMQNAFASYCTDFNYDHAIIDEHHLKSVSKLDIMPHFSNLFMPRYTALNDLKVTFPSLRTFLTVTESKDITFTTIVLDVARNRDFVSSCVYNLRLWGFDGLIVKWLHPPVPEYLTRLLVDLRNAFDSDYRMQRKGVANLLLGVTVTGQNGVADNLYQVYAISSLVDFITLLMFDDNPVFNKTTRLTCSLHEIRPVVPNKTHTTQPTTRDPITRTTILPHTTDANRTASVTGRNQVINNTVIANRTASVTGRNQVINNTVNASARIEILPEMNIEMYPDLDDYFDSSVDNTENLTSSINWTKSNTTESDHGGISIEQVQDPAAEKQFVIDKAINEWQALGAHKSQMIIGLSLIGQGYILKKKSSNGIGAPTKGPVPPSSGKIPGQVFFYEMCVYKPSGTVKRVSSTDLTPYWYNDTVWISYEDMASLAQKVEYLRDAHVLGLMLFSQSEDDFTGSNCGLGSFPVSNMIFNNSRVYMESFKPQGQHDWQQFCDNAMTMPTMTSLRLLLVVCLRYLLL